MPGGLSEKKARAPRAFISLSILLILSAFSLLAAIAWGSTGFKFREFFDYLFHGISGAEVILFKIRLPRALLSYLVGGGLAVAGCCLQGVFKNPMADSHILGVSAGAGFGAAACIALGFGGAGFGLSAFGLGSVALGALAGGIFAVLLVTQFARVGRRTSASALLLAGVAVSSFFTALTSGIMILHRESMEQVVYWTLGSFSSASFEKVRFAALLILPCAALCMLFARPLNIMLLGEEDARMLGVDTVRTTRALVILTTLLAAGCVSVSGIVGFVGLMLPHILRLMTGPDHRLLLPCSFLGGGVFLCLADTLARSLFPPLEVPVGVLSALFGVPFFLYLLRRQSKGGRA